MLNVGSVADRVIKIETGFSNWQVPKVGLWTVLQYFDITLCSCIKTTYISSIFRTNRKCLTDKGSFLYSQTGCVNSATTTLLWWICLGKKLSKLNLKKNAFFCICDLYLTFWICVGQPLQRAMYAQLVRSQWKPYELSVVLNSNGFL